MSRMRFTFAATGFLLLLSSGCATAINGRWQKIQVDSYPRGATIAVKCGNSPATPALTPAYVVVERRATDCRVTLAKNGYEPQEIAFERQLSNARHANKIVGVPLGLVAAIGVGILLPEDILSTNDLEGSFNAGMELGSAPGNQIDKHLGGAYKQVPGELFVVLIRESKAPSAPDPQDR